MAITETTKSLESATQRLTLARVTGVAGLVTLVVVLGSSLANDYQSAAFSSDADETGRSSGRSTTPSARSAPSPPRSD